MLLAQEADGGCVHQSGELPECSCKECVPKAMWNIFTMVVVTMKMIEQIMSVYVCVCCCSASLHCCPEKGTGFD